MDYKFSYNSVNLISQNFSWNGIINVNLFFFFCNGLEQAHHKNWLKYFISVLGLFVDKMLDTSMYWTEISWVILKICAGKKFLFAHEFLMSMGCKNL